MLSLCACATEIARRHPVPVISVFPTPPALLPTSCKLSITQEWRLGGLEKWRDVRKDSFHLLQVAASTSTLSHSAPSLPQHPSEKGPVTDLCMLRGKLSPSSTT